MPGSCFPRTVFFYLIFFFFFYLFNLQSNMVQDPEAGGFADRPGNMVDVYHTHFGIAGLSLLGLEGLQEVDPV